MMSRLSYSAAIDASQTLCQCHPMQRRNGVSRMASCIMCLQEVAPPMYPDGSFRCPEHGTLHRSEVRNPPLAISYPGP
jgi:hypothetical protein